jgi:hypothetical protein
MTEFWEDLLHYSGSQVEDNGMKIKLKDLLFSI